MLWPCQRWGVPDWVVGIKITMDDSVIAGVKELFEVRIVVGGGGGDKRSLGRGIH